MNILQKYLNKIIIVFLVLIGLFLFFFFDLQNYLTLDYLKQSKADLIAYFVQEKDQGDTVLFDILRNGNTVQVSVPVK